MDRSTEGFLAANPGIGEVSRSSTAFGELRIRAALDIDGERLYLVRGDTLGSEGDLLVEVLVRGARSTDPGDPCRQLFLELDPASRRAVRRRLSEV